MATIKNIIQTVFTTKGSDSTASSIKGVSKAATELAHSHDTATKSQTRLAQSSASAGRSFAAQSQGLGGLVAAYAGAAATVFALQQAYAALNAAAKADTMVRGTNTLAQAIGQSGPKILKSIQEITQGQLTMAEAAQTANIALSAGFNTKQIEGFTTVAIKASRALGRDFSDAMERVSRGAAKLEPELLDELGIFTRIGPATEAYAKKLGVTANSLNEFQRRQAFANAIIDEGNRKFATIDTSSDSLQKSFEQLRVRITELATGTAQLVATVLEPLVNFLSGDLGNSILLFGSILGMVFKKTSQEIGGWAGNQVSKMSDWASALAAKAAEAKGSFKKIAVDAADLQKDISKRATELYTTGAKAGQKIYGAGLSGEARFGQAGVEKDLARQAATIRQEFLKNVQITPADMQKNIQILTDVQERLAKGGHINSAAYSDATRMINSYSSALAAGGVRVKGYTALSKALTKSVELATGAFNLASTAMNVLFFAVGAAQLVGTLFDIDILGSIVGLFKDLSQASKDAKSGFSGMISSAAGGADALQKALKGAGASDEFIEGVDNKIKELQKEAGKWKSGLDQLAEYEISAELGGSASSAKYSGSLNGLEGVAKEVEQLKLVKAELQQTFASTGDADIQGKIILLDYMIESVERMNGAFGEFGKFAGQLSRAIGLSTDQIANIASSADSIVLTKDKMVVLGQEIKKVQGSFDFTSLTEDQKALVEAGFLAENTLKDLNSATSAGVVNTQLFGQQIAGVQSQLDSATAIMAKNKAELTGMGLSLALVNESNEGLANSIAQLRSKLDVYSEMYDHLLALENLGKNLESVFSKELKLFDTAQIEGAIHIVDDVFQIATSGEEKTRFQAEYLTGELTKIASKYKDIGSFVDQAMQGMQGMGPYTAEMSANIAIATKDTEVFNAGVEAVAGTIIQATIEAKNLGAAFSSEASKIQSQMESFALEQKVVAIQAQLDTSNLEASLQKTISDLEGSVIQAEIELIEAKVDLGTIDPTKGANDIYQKQEQLFDLQVQAEVDRFNKQMEALELQAQLVAAQTEIQKATLLAETELAIQEANNRAENVRATIAVYTDFLTQQTAVLNRSNEANAKTLKSGADAMATAIFNALPAEFRGTIAVSQVTANKISEVPGLKSAQSALDSLDDSLSSLTTSIVESFAQQDEAIDKLAKTTLDNIEKEKASAQKAHELTIERMGIERETLDVNHKKRLKDIAEDGADSAKKAAEALEELQDMFSSAIENMLSSVSSAVKDVLGVVGDYLSTSLQARIDTLQAQETIVSGVLSSATEKLDSAQSDLASSLENEVSLREDLKSKTDELIASQKTFIAGLGDQDAKLTDLSKNYVANLLAQKRTMIQLYSATRKSAALDKQVKSLVEIQIDLQTQLDSVTAARTAAEEKLANTQSIISGLTEVLSGAFLQLGQSIVAAGQSIQQVMQMLGMATGAGVPSGDLITKSFGQVMNPINKNLQDFKETLVEAKGAVLKTGGNVQGLSNTLGIVDKTMSVMSGAMQGFSIGGALGSLLGDTTGASSIGGAIGGAIGKAIVAFAPKLATNLITSIIGPTLTSAIGASMGALVSFALPIIGSLIGGLLGSLFRKRPKGGAATEYDVSSRKYETVSQYAKGGMSNDTVDAIKSLPKLAIDSILTTLDAVGATMRKGMDKILLTTDIGSSGTIYGSLKANDKTYSDSFGKGQDAGNIAAQFFADAFLSSLKKGDILVDALAPSADRLQNAIDYFLRPVEDNIIDGISSITRTTDELQKVLEFATTFDDKLIELSGTGYTTVEVFDSIDKAANANAASLLKYYRTFAYETADVFGEASEEYASVTSGIRKSALAQLGLAEVTKDGVTTLTSLTEAQNEVNAGSVMVHNVLSAIASQMKIMRELPGNTDTAKELRAIKNKAIRTNINDLLTNVSDSLQAGIDSISNPSYAAVSQFTSVLENGAARIATTQGIYDELLATANDPKTSSNVTSKQLARSEKIIELAKQVSDLELTTFLQSLTSTELLAIKTTKDLDETTKNLVDTQIASIKALEDQRALSILTESAQSLSSALSDATDSFIQLTVGGIRKVSADALELASIFDRTKSDKFVYSYKKVLDNIYTGVKVSVRYTKGLKLLNSELTKGKITSEQYAKGVETLNAAVSEQIQYTKELAVEYENTIETLISAIEDARGAVKSSIESLGESITSSIQIFVDKTYEILGVYDSTLLKVANSGNKLFDLQDKASTALEAAAEAVKQFEEENKLSGRTSAEVSAELASVNAQLQSMLSAPVDLSSFMKLSELSTSSRKLSTELSTLNKVQTEYSKLLKTQEDAKMDVAFVESTLLELGDKAIDTRRAESEVIQQTEDAAYDLIKGQEELISITEKLSEANFNLNQARYDEESAVTKVATALEELSKAKTTLDDSISEILSDDDGVGFLRSFVETAVANARVYFNSIEGDVLESALGAYKAETVEQALSQVSTTATTAANNLITLADNIDSYLNHTVDVAEAATGEYTALAYDSEVVLSGLTDRFKSFNSDLVKYLDTEGLSKFYGSGGLFKQFRDSLQLNLVTDGFGFLTASGGPLETFNYTLTATKTSLDKLVASGAYANVTFGLVNTSIGKLVTAFATTETQSKVAAASLVIFNDAAISTAEITDTLTTAVGNFTIKVNSTNTGNAISLLTEGLPSGITEFYQSILAFNVDVASLDIDTAISDLATEVYTEISLYNSSVGSLNVNSTASKAALNIKAQFNLINSTVGQINIGNVVSNVASMAAIAIKSEFNIVNSVIGQIGVANITGNLASQAAINIVSELNLVDSVIDQIDVANITGDLASQAAVNIVSEFNLVDSVIDQIDVANITGDLASQAAIAIKSEFNVVNSVIDQIGVANITGNLASQAAIAIKSEFNIVNSVIDQIDVANITGDLASQAAADIRTDFNLADTRISQLTVANITGNLASQSAINIVSEFNLVDSVIEQIDVANITGDLASQAAADIRTDFNLADTRISQLTVANITGDLASKAAAEIRTDFNLADTRISQLTVANITGDLASQAAADIRTDFNLANTIIGSISVTNAVTNLATSIASQISNGSNPESLVSKLNVITVSNAGIVANIKNQISNSGNANSLESKLNAITVSNAGIVTNIKNQISNGNYANSLESKLNAITVSNAGIITNIKNQISNGNDANSLESKLNAVTVSTKGIVSNIANSITNASNENSLAYYLNNATITTSATTYTKGLSGLVSGSIATFQQLLDVFTVAKVSLVSTLSTNLASLYNTLQTVENTPGLIAVIKAYNTEQNSSAYKLGVVTEKFTALNTALTDMLGTDGSIKSVNLAITGIASDITDAWNSAVDLLNPENITVSATVNAGFSSSDSENIAALVYNSALYPQLKGAEYDKTGTMGKAKSAANASSPEKLATGGYVSGKGTSTSDSIPAKLSNGEYVLRASTVKKLGRSLLDTLNTSGSLHSALSYAGRNGDSLVAHITPQEANELRLAGGAGTRNPVTGLLEFYRDGGAVGKVFRDQEVDKLWSTYGQNMPYYDQRYIDENMTLLKMKAKINGPSAQIGYIGTTQKYVTTKWSYSDDQYEDTIHRPLFNPDDMLSIGQMGAMAGILAGRAVASRYPEDKLETLENIYGGGSSGLFGGNYSLNKQSAMHANFANGTVSAYKRGAIDLGVPKWSKNTPGVELYARPSQLLQLIANDKFGKSIKTSSGKLTKEDVGTFIDAMNEGPAGNFTDLYMLKDLAKPTIRGSVPAVGESTSYGFSTGGLVSKRDSINAMLEPGEFVLRKQAVERMGLDAANKLNSTGTTNDGDVEVNIINNGTPQTAVATPEVRRENGKLIVDIILEDLRTNGPINKQIRSLR